MGVYGRPGAPVYTGKGVTIGTLKYAPIKLGLGIPGAIALGVVGIGGALFNDGEIPLIGGLFDEEGEEEPQQEQLYVITP